MYINTYAIQQYPDIYLLHVTDTSNRSHISEPFCIIINLHGPHGEQVYILGTVNSRAMINALDATTYCTVAHSLIPLSPSAHMLRMTDRLLIPSLGT